MAVEPFRIEVSDEVLEDLRERLRRTRWPGEVAGSGWTYGTNLAFLKELVQYWIEKYNWRAAEARLNEWPQFMSTSDGLRIHFAQVRGRGPSPIPLIISHGWPGSFAEFLEVAGPLTDPAAHGGSPDDAFDLVIPSLPGYGFSPDPNRPGVTPAVIADAFARLMTEDLGYARFGAQGGDWGSLVTSQLGYRHPDKVLGIHLNMLGARPFTGPGTPPLTPDEDAMRQAARRWQDEEAGYQHIQGTRPQTLAYALTDSPAGLAGWIAEKFRAWTDCDGDIERAVSRDFLLTNIMIYWVSGCINSSMRLYYEVRHAPWLMKAGEMVTVPSGFAVFPKEITRPPRSWAERAYNVHHWTELPRGGHFAAVEQPGLLVEDIRSFFRPLRGATSGA